MQPSGKALKYNSTSLDVAATFGYSVEYVRDLAREGKIPCIKRVRQYRFNLDEVAEAIDAMGSKGGVVEDQQSESVYESQTSVDAEDDDIDWGI